MVHLDDVFHPALRFRHLRLNHLAPTSRIGMMCGAPIAFFTARLMRPRDDQDELCSASIERTSCYGCEQKFFRAIYTPLGDECVIARRPPLRVLRAVSVRPL